MSLKLRAPFRRAHLTAAAAVIALGLGVVPGLGLASASASDGTVASSTGNVKNAVYRGPGPWGAVKIAAYESVVGHKVDYVLDFQDTDTWNNQEWPDWQANAWKDRTVVLGATGIFPGGWDRTFKGSKVGWSQAASGEYDAHWRRLGERLVATGQAGAILRGAHEFNGGWFAHRVHPEEAADFVAAWRRWVTIMRAVPGQAFVFDWNPTIGKQWPLYKAEVAYPGDAYVDHIAVDVYDGWYKRGWKADGTPPTAAERDAVWNETLNGERGLRFWRDFAEARGKKISLPEWGLRRWQEKDGLIHGGGDNAAFVERMAGIIKDPAWRVAYHAFWEDPGAGISDPDKGLSLAVPEARAAYLKAFGGTSTPPAAAAPLAPVAPVPVVDTAGLDCTNGVRVASAAELPLHFSRWKDRSWKSELTGRTVSGDVFVWATATGAQKIRFGLDATAPRVDVEAPFDLVDGNRWWAEALDTMTMTKGEHTVEIIAQRSDGCLTRTATFTVAPTITRTVARTAPVPAVETAGLDCTKGVRAASAVELPLHFSRWKDRSWKSELTGRTVSGDVFAWVTATGAQKVRFGLDAATPRVDVEAPFDLVDGHKWWAEALDTSTLTKGEHSVKLVAQRPDGCLARTATFTVA